MLNDEDPKCGGYDDGYAVDEIYECKDAKDYLGSEDLENCDLCHNLGHQFFTCKRTNKIAVTCLIVGAATLVGTPCVDSMRVRK